MVEILINLATQKVREENNYDGPPTLNNNNLKSLKTWLTRAGKNAENAAQGQLPIRSQIRTIIEKYSYNDG